jgi:hypothetical protein
VVEASSNTAEPRSQNPSRGADRTASLEILEDNTDLNVRY